MRSSDAVQSAYEGLVLGYRQKDADKVEPPKRPFERVEGVKVRYCKEPGWKVAFRELAKSELRIGPQMNCEMNEILGKSSSDPSLRFTPTQGQYLAFIYAYTRIQGRPPAEADMQRHFNVTPPTVHQMVLTLERNGLVQREPGVARGIRILVAPELLPILR